MPASDEDYQKPPQKVHLFTLEKDGKVWDETEYGDMDQLAALSVSVDEMDDCDEDNYERKEFTFDFETGTYCADFSGEWFDAEDGDSGSIWIDTGQLREIQKGPSDSTVSNGSPAILSTRSFCRYRVTPLKMKLSLSVRI